jgi:deoxyribodipyrimidine photolyase-related protein
MSQSLWICGTQLSHNSAGLKNISKDRPILMVESLERSQWYNYSKIKLVLIFSAMRHFRDELIEKGYTVDYYKIPEDTKPQHKGFNDALQIHLKKFKSDKVLFMKDADISMNNFAISVFEKLKIKYKLFENNLFLTDLMEFEEWASSQKRLLMENHYRRMRKKYNILLDENGNPEGGEWNYDKENRLPFKGKHKAGVKIPKPLNFEPDELTSEVIRMVEFHFKEGSGDTSKFSLPVTANDTIKYLKDFAKSRLVYFGKFEDAMVDDERILFHSFLSPLINIGLISPMEVVSVIIDAYKKGFAPLNSVEGFLRQIIGWREYMYGIYHYNLNDYSEINFFNSENSLPEFFWNGETKMYCVSKVVKDALEAGYSHHIPRLMVLSNFFTLADINPKHVLKWFMDVYIDAYEWVMIPNIFGMGMFADGGNISTKPYIASANYIDKMSDYCSKCSYKKNLKTGESACPFNYLYWNFLDKHKDKLKNNQRMMMIYNLLEKKSNDELREIKNSSEKFIKSLT